MSDVHKEDQVVSRGFGPKVSWVAVSSVSAAELAAALDIEKLEPADWEAGIDLAYEWTGPGITGLGVFITPPLRQWTLCVGIPLFKEQKGFAAELSRGLGGREVQHFATHRVSEGHSWERAIGGETTRYFWTMDGEQRQEGEPTAEGLACGFRINPSDAELAGSGDEDDDWDDLWWPDEDFVLALAGAWSIDPSLIEEEFADAGPGFIGRTAPQPSATKPDEPRRSWIRSVWRSLAGQ